MKRGWEKNEAYRRYFKKRNISQEITDRFTIWLTKQNNYKKDCTETEISENRGYCFRQFAQPLNTFGKKREFNLPMVSFLNSTWFIMKLDFLEKNPIGPNQVKLTLLGKYELKFENIRIRKKVKMCIRKLAKGKLHQVGLKEEVLMCRKGTS